MVGRGTQFTNCFLLILICLTFFFWHKELWFCQVFLGKIVFQKTQWMFLIICYYKYVWSWFLPVGSWSRWLQEWSLGPSRWVLQLFKVAWTQRVSSSKIYCEEGKNKASTAWNGTPAGCRDPAFIPLSDCTHILLIGLFHRVDWSVLTECWLVCLQTLS